MRWFCAGAGIQLIRYLESLTCVGTMQIAVGRASGAKLLFELETNLAGLAPAIKLAHLLGSCLICWLGVINYAPVPP